MSEPGTASSSASSSAPTTRAGMGVRAQLILGFALIGALLLAASFVVLRAGAGVQAALNTTAEQALPKWNASYQVALQVSEIARLLRDAVLVEMQEDLPVALERMQASQQRIDSLMARLQTSTADANQQALLARITEAATAFQNDRRQFISHLEGGARGQARGMLTGALRQSQAAYQTALDAYRQAQDHDVAQATASAGQAMQHLSLQLAAAFALIAAVGLGVALTLVRGLSRRLGAEPTVVAQAMLSVSRGNLSPQPLGLSTSAAAEGSVIASLGAMVAALREAVTEVRAASTTVADRSEAIVMESEHLSQRTEQQSAELQQAAAALEEFAATMTQSQQTVRDADALARSACDVAAQSQASVEQATAKMQSVSAFGLRVAETTSMIDALAFQTNILALNAAVEAARAGERGQGFAVVAGEVRSLALSSAESAKAITALIRASNEAIRDCQQFVDGARERTATVISAVQSFAALMARVERATSEQTIGVQQLTEVLSRIDQFTQHNASLVEGSRAAAGELQGQSQRLVAAVAHFRLEAGAEHSG